MKKGIAVSPGVAVGTAYCMLEIFVDPDTKRLEDREVTAELARYETARDKAIHDLRALRRKVEHQVGIDEAAIFGVHEAILRDAAFTNKIRHWIVDDRLNGPAALQRLLHEYSALFAKSGDEYLQERLADLRDVIVRLGALMSDVLEHKTPSVQGPLIVVADELLPSQVVALEDADVKGIVTQRGSQTSHAAIIARSRGIPCVSGVRHVLRHVHTGDTLVVDGREGQVFVNPDAEALSAYLKLEREFVDLKDHLAANRDHSARTADDVPLELLANINSVTDARAAGNMGACGVGLYRTEYLYLMHPDVPDEQEQFEAYVKIIEASPQQRVTIRTLDIGGDKTVPYLGHTHQEANPFMGWRSIRLSFEHPEFFGTQVRAVLRAAAEFPEREVRLLFPMITTLEEMRRVRAMVHRSAERLQAEGKRQRLVPMGMMLEVPAAAVTIRSLLRAVDFVSVGSNDLVQYLMAADRDNPKVSHLCQPLSPAVLKVLAQVVRSCRRGQVPVTLCGEMAGQPSGFLVLLGMGLRSFSMSPAIIPTIKELASQVTVPQAESVYRQAIRFKTTRRVRRYLAEMIAQIAPGVAMLDTA